MRRRLASPPGSRPAGGRPPPAGRGHAAGDAVIQAVGALLLRTARDGDTVGRLGGEEFGVLLPDATEDEARDTAERVRRAVADLAVPVDGETLAVTVSAGVARSGGAGDTLAPLLARADGALYEAKRRGRDRVVVAPGPPAPRRDEA